MIKEGDLFECDGQIVVGFADTFDTDTTEDRLVHRASVQAQVVQLYFGGNAALLDLELDRALVSHSPIAHESRDLKPHGKLARYPIGTALRITGGGRSIYAVVYGRINNDCSLLMTLDSIWAALAELWRVARISGNMEPIAMPLFSSRFGRLVELDREGLLEMMILSFVANSRLRSICRQLEIVIPKGEYQTLDRVRIEQFLRSV